MVHLLASVLLGGGLAIAANALAIAALEPRADELHARSVWTHNRWNFPKGQNVKVTPGSDLCLIHYLPTNLELFYVVNQQPWHSYDSEAHPNFVAESLVGFWDLIGAEAYNGITAITRSSENMEVFYSSGDNTIHSRYWTPSTGWKNTGDFKAISSADDTGIVGVSREVSHMEIFYIGTNNLLMHSYTVDAGSHWFTDSVFAGSDYGNPTKKGMGVLSRNDQHQQIWWITTAGAISMATWGPLNGWIYDHLRVDGTAHPNSGMAVLARSNVRMNIFYIGNDNKVYQGYWKTEEPQVWRFEKLSDLPAAPGSLTAVSMNSQHMEVFWTAPDGNPIHAWWYESTGKWTSNYLTGDRPCVPGGSITSTSRKNGCMDIYCTGPDGLVVQFSYS